MASKKEKLIDGEIYHIILRGVGDTEIFKDIKDYYRGIFSIYELNNARIVDIRQRRSERKKEKTYKGLTFVDRRDVFVEILAFCFMPNHIHLLIKQTKNEGISRFMQKLGTGYAMFFNKKYQRKGHLFSKFKAVRIKGDEQLRVVFTYIHANPISLIEPGWKEKGIKNSQKVIKFLENYRWSSYQDYIGKENFVSVTQRDFLSEFIGGANGCKKAVNDWIKCKKETTKV